VGLSTTWFVIAVIVILLGVGCCSSTADRRAAAGASRTGGGAALRDWEFLDTDPVLPSRWRYGTIHQGGPGVARNPDQRRRPHPDGPRQAYVFDHEQAGRITSVLVAIQAQTQLARPSSCACPPRLCPTTWRSSTWSRSGPLPSSGRRRRAPAAHAQALPRLRRGGRDVELLWAEESWVLATAPADSTADRLQDLLADLAEVATALEQAQNAHT
jgi:hypothetical protein